MTKIELVTLNISDDTFEYIAADWLQHVTKRNEEGNSSIGLLGYISQNRHKYEDE